MSTLKRYRKPGGFKQLMDLVETSPSAKREQLLKIVGAEDKRWADELNRRMLSAEKVFSWDVEAIEKILMQIPEQTWPKAVFFLGEPGRTEKFESLIKFLPNHKQQQMREYFKSLNPSASEVDAANILIFKKIRSMQAAGDFRPERYDPNLSMDGVERLMV